MSDVRASELREVRASELCEVRASELRLRRRLVSNDERRRFSAELCSSDVAGMDWARWRLNSVSMTSSSSMLSSDAARDSATTGGAMFDWTEERSRPARGGRCACTKMDAKEERGAGVGGGYTCIPWSRIAGFGV